MNKYRLHKRASNELIEIKGFRYKTQVYRYLRDNFKDVAELRDYEVVTDLEDCIPAIVFMKLKNSYKYFR